MVPLGLEPGVKVERNRDTQNFVCYFRTELSFGTCCSTQADGLWVLLPCSVAGFSNLKGAVLCMHHWDASQGSESTMRLRVKGTISSLLISGCGVLPGFYYCCITEKKKSSTPWFHGQPKPRKGTEVWGSRNSKIMLYFCCLLLQKAWCFGVLIQGAFQAVQDSPTSANGSLFSCFVN